MKAVILAAGSGTRLHPYTEHIPKCMIELEGIPLAQRQVTVMRQLGIEDIFIVTGYLADAVKLDGVTCLHNSNYESTNMVATLFEAREIFDGEDDVVVSYGDIVYESKVLRGLVEDANPLSVVVDTDWLKLWSVRMPDPLDDAETMKIDDTGFIYELGQKPKDLDEIQGQYIGLIKFRSDLAGELVNIYESMDTDAIYDGKDFDNMYMTSFIQSLIDSGVRAKSVPIANRWLEVDTATDYETYQSMSKSGALGSLITL